MKTCPPAEQFLLFVKIKAKRIFCSLRVQNYKLPLWNTHRLVFISLHRCCLSWLLTYCTKNATLIQEQFTENLLPVPVPWQFSSKCPLRRLAAGPVWVMPKISNMFFVFVLLCFYIFFPSFLEDEWKKESLKRVLLAKSLQLQTVGLSLFDSICAPKTWNSKAGFKGQQYKKYRWMHRAHMIMSIFFCTNERKYKVMK